MEAKEISFVDIKGNARNAIDGNLTATVLACFGAALYDLDVVASVAHCCTNRLRGGAKRQAVVTTMLNRCRDANPPATVGVQVARDAKVS